MDLGCLLYQQQQNATLGSLIVFSPRPDIDTGLPFFQGNRSLNKTVAHPTSFHWVDTLPGGVLAIKFIRTTVAGRRKGAKFESCRRPQPDDIAGAEELPRPVRGKTTSSSSAAKRKPRTQTVETAPRNGGKAYRGPANWPPNRRLDVLTARRARGLHGAFAGPLERNRKRVSS